MLKLNLGSGSTPLSGYENIDIKDGKSAYPLVQYADNSLDEIRASHILEHFPIREVYKVLKNWHSKLKPGGVLKISVPDFALITQEYLKGDNLPIAMFVCGSQENESDFHKSIFDKKGLTAAFEKIGLENITGWKSEIADCASYPISLNLQGTKKTEERPSAGSPNALCRPVLEEIVKKASNVYSQNGEDGILAELFARIGTENKWCLEVGAADGIMFSNTRRLVEQGWNAILIEKDNAQYEKLVKNCEKFPNVHCINMELLASGSGENSLDEILAKYDAPEDIDLVCIDVDGQDWHIWNQMVKYTPRVVVIEFDIDNGGIPAIGGDGQAGKDAVEKLASSKQYHYVLQTKYNMLCIHNDAARKLLTPGTSRATVTSKEEAKNTGTERDIKTVAVMSMPRLAFTDNIFTAVGTLLPLGITLERGMGVFWGQVLTRMIEKHLDDGTDYIITLDYDTYFSQNHIIRLLQLMQEHPEADAIIPIQSRRECDHPLFCKHNYDGMIATTAKTSEFRKELTDIATGHFGLTIFRVESLKRLKHPWFLPVPDENGRWGEKRQDEDIYFWLNFKRQGFKAFLANNIKIGHMQLMITWPGTLETGWKPKFQYLTDAEEKGIPEDCRPEVELLK